MPIKVIDNGQNNNVSIPESTNLKSNAQIVFNGDNNTISIGENCTFNSALIRVGSNCQITIGDKCRLAKIDVFMAKSAHLFVGRQVSCTWESRVYAHEPSTIEIGSDCLIANGALITSSDMHSIIDVASGTRINKASDIHIGDHVWLAEEVNVMKGSLIGNDTVIGARSIVTGEIPNNCVAVGSPAKVVKTGTTWSPELL